MAGLYIHIPFCKQACHYCNFHFSTSLRYKEQMVLAISKEVHYRHNYLTNAKLESIYFGGGTPSLLDEKDFELLFDTIHRHFTLAPNAEITLEANPDDITIEKLAIWRKHSINRLSIGIQSFSDKDLAYMNRAHNAQEARNCIKMATDAGFHNLTVDLIYGSPTTSDEIWEENVKRLFDLNIPHLSCYALTVEPKTALDYKIAKKLLAPIDEEQSARQFELLMKWMAENQYVHYETSNFAKDGYFAKHNTAYWQGASYLGIGPSAHSFNGYSRQWNIANNAKYLQCFENNHEPLEKVNQLKKYGLFEIEVLSDKDQYNELVLTGLRTIWGVDLNKIPAAFQQHFKENINQFIDTNHVFFSNNKYTLSPKGRLISDFIASSVFT